MIALAGVAIDCKIYESSASLVYRGRNVQDHRAIVVKQLKQDYPSSQELTRYRQEYEITRSLELEGVVKAYSQQDYQRTLIILLEDFGGESLEYWIQNRPETYCPMLLAPFLQMAIDLTDILSKIHAANIIHKDINPGNIVLNPVTGVVKIIDFGIATRFNRTNPTFKSPHELEGTLAYLSPEQTGRMNRSLDYRSDFYSLGVTFYELLTGQLPFETTDILELVHCHIAKSPVPPHELSATIPKPVSDLVLKLMAKNAEDRYQSAWGIKADLGACLRQLAETDRMDAVQLGLQDVSDQFQIPQKLYGREAESAALLAAFDRVMGDESLSSDREFMLVSGYAGIGKSALVQELYKPITAHRGYFVWGKFDQFQRNTPYSAIASALQKLVQQLLGEPEPQVQQWRSQLLTVLGNNGQIIIDVIPEVELIIGKQPPMPEVGATEAQNRFDRVFQQFIRVFCSAEHPLVIFLDDLQWVDSATLRLIELMMMDAETQYLFLIGAYRDNEVNSTHSLMITLESLKQEQVTLSHITLTPLELNAIAQLIADTLHSDIVAVSPLAELVLRKTGGNPFFVTVFLKTLYAESLLRFDVKQLRWQWDIAQIESKEITDNVVELMLGRLQILPIATQQVLRLAACIGADFDLSTLSIVCERSPDEMFSELVTAVQSGLIVPISELDEHLLVQEYRFLHDRIQQAAYALIDDSQKQAVHLQIGRSLLERTRPEQTEQLFEIVDHLNHGIELVSNSAERTAMARLNLRAGQKAKTAIAYSAARKYLATGRALLEESSWQTDYDLTLALYSETTEVAFLCGDFEAVAPWVEMVLQNAKTVLDGIKVYEVKIQTNIAQNQPLTAIQTALQLLQHFSIRFPEAPSQSDIQLELDAIAALIGSKPIEDLIHLPQMTESDKLAAMRLLASITIVAYIAAPDLMPLLAAKQVNLSIQYGNAFASPFAYALCGLILCGMVGNIETGYQFGQLALRQLSHPDTYSLRARTLMVVNIFIIHRKDHIREILQPLLEAYQSGLETGDVEFAAYCAHTYCLQSFVAGEELVKVEREMRTFGEVIHQFRQETAFNWAQIFHQFILNLGGSSVNPIRLIGESYNEENRLKHEKDGFAIFLVYFHKLFLCNLFSEYDQAVTSSTEAENYLLQVRATPCVPLYYLHDSLARLATYPRSSNQAQLEILEKVAANQEEIKQWADHAPMNYLHKYKLVQAETARVLGQVLEAEEFYEQAIQGAKDSEYLQEEALAYELAAKFYLDRNRVKFAQTYLKEAHYCYERWGATAKVKDLEARYPQLLPQSNEVQISIARVSKTTSNRSPIAFDLAAVMKAAQAISSEIELDRLLGSLMQILIENAGAQTGFLILKNAEEWVIEASCELDDGKTVCVPQVLQSRSVTNLPESIIHRVIRTHESVLLNNATHEGDFINEPYIQQNQTRSIFCLPLLKQSKLVGVLYLENQIAAGAFTPERSQVLHLLSSQAAIAIENAKLYSELREGESRMTQFLEAIPIGISVVDATGRPYYANQWAIQLTGKGIDPSVTADQLAEVYQVYSAGTDYLYPTERMPIVRALSGERTKVDDVEIRQNNVTIPVESSGTPVFDEQGNVVYAIAAFQDITERKQTERLLADYNQTLEQQVAQRTAALQASEAELRGVYDELRLREQQLRLITDALPVCIFYTDRNQYYRFVNQTCEIWFNCNQDEIIGKRNRDFLGETAYQRVDPYIQQALAGQITTYEAELFYPSGKKHISAIYIPDFDRNDQVRGYYGLITDVSEQRNAALRERQRSEEALLLEERNRMAREIHDTLAQAFTSIIVHINAVSQRLTLDPSAAQSQLKTARTLARSGLADARRSVEALRPQILEEGNLYSALDRFATQMFSHTLVQVVCEAIGEPNALPKEVETNLLRIGQEALTNAFKYANASEVRVELRYEESQCVLRIKDNGQGFEKNSLTVGRGFGLLGMTERAERIGAELSIVSHSGQGTEISVRVQTP